MTAPREPERTRVLGEGQRTKEWLSSLTGAHYRWNGVNWESRRRSSDMWFAATVVTDNVGVDVLAYAGETFVEVP